MENEILGQILAELKSLNVRQEKVEEKLAGLDVRQNSMAEELMAFQEFAMQKFVRLENQLQRINGTIENEINPSIQALAEGNIAMREQLDWIEKRLTSHDEIIFHAVK